MTRVLMILLLILIPVISNAYIVFDPSNYVQNLLTARNSVTSLLNQAKMLELQIKSMRQLGHLDTHNILPVLRQIDAISKQGMSLSYALDNLQDKFDERYPDYQSDEEVLSFDDATKTRSKSTLDTLKSTLTSLQLAMQQLSREQQQLQKLKQKNKTIDGKMKAMQLSNQFASQSIEQLQSIKRILASQINAQSAYMAHQVSAAAYEEAMLTKITDNLPSDEREYHPHKTFGLFKSMH